MRRMIKSLRRPKRAPDPQEQPELDVAIEALPIQACWELPAAPLTRTGEPELPRIPLYYELPEAPQIVELELPRPPTPCDVPEAPPRPLTPTADRRCWRDQIIASSLSSFVANEQGFLRQRDVDQLASATRGYLNSWEGYHAGQGSDRDTILLDLMADWGRDLDSAVATLACTGFLSASEASSQLASLIHLDSAMYLRCLAVAGKFRAGLIREDEARAIQQIQRLQPQSDLGIEHIENFINAFTTCRPSIFLPDELIQDWLSKNGIIDRLDAEVVIHWEQQRLHTAFRLVRCIEIICSLPGGPDMRSGWNGPFWQACLCWAPNTERLLQWESGCLSDAQRRQLSTLISLDGPDTATCRESCLRLSDPTSFSRTQVEPQTTGTLEQMLVLLSGSERVGTNTVDLFIYLLIENPETQSSFDFLKHALDQGGSDESHRTILNFLRSQHNNNLDICTQMIGLSSLLPLLSSTMFPDSIGNLVTRIAQVMSAAQSEFVAQLDNGPGDYVGMSILAFGKAILAAKAVHPNLPPDLLEMVRRFPEPDVAQSIFERLEDAALSKSRDCSALKSYLVSSLGGRTEFAAGDVDLTDIQLEVKFWKSCPDAHRRDLAMILASIKRLDYKTYVTCLGSVILEKDQFVKELRVTLMEKHWGSCAKLISYVSLRRSLGQLSADCWTMLVFAFIEENGSFSSQGKSHMRTMDQWLGFIQYLAKLTAPVAQAQLRDSGDGITRRRLTWWRTLSGYATALRLIETLVKGFEDVEWIFLTGEEASLLTLIEHAQKGKDMPDISRLVICQLKADGRNLVLVSNMLHSLAELSQHGAAILQMMLTRAVEQSHWTNLSLAAVCKAWLNSPLPTNFDKTVFRMMRENLKPIPPFTRKAALSLLGQLVGEHDSLVERAAQLETSRWNLKRTDARGHSRLLHEAGIRDTPFRATGQGIPVELADAVEEVAPNEYELSFPLTGLNELQRMARGVPDGARLLVVRVCLTSSRGFCVHYAPNDEATGNRHQYWKKSSNTPDRPICGTKPSLFTYCLSRNLHRLLKNPQTIATIHNSIEKWVTTSPTTCGVCGALISVRLWKTAACSQTCSIRFRQAPLEVRLHNLMVDPLSMDLLISSVYAAALDGSALDLLPGCPVAKASLPTVINSLPSMETLARAPSLSRALQNSRYAVDQERLLSWLCLSFRGFLRSVPSGFAIPSMPQTQQFLLMNSHHEREKAFETHLGATASAGSGPVFHGTSISRLYLILSAGLKNVSNTPLMRHGAASGPGVYCGDEQATSLGYSQAIGNNWSNSAIDQQMRVMLGCELAKYPTANTPTHVVTDETRVLVRSGRAI
ncbi:uncharacterized protein NECHADRAFT_83215 [Fusarium vanettenii 77-13-4]|uniref:PARP catalytic domain-containing protein n=1 Tax=Fusarium vanettenii (strain ATCC MYA-4622 / CBS 123669 / FGSC 9596 / NRRL 45880 / 77-13-4) TaxID=660122 RepID=C7ZB58_FUSV7|nr:uncharacterized protein NECHADRAFT_83215 [Fusarium vanettenii 77-13-4]EEU38750.1 hypothetical protein NECHADRAFT_83215 [Fusarium vanettenii 77-13-4]